MDDEVIRAFVHQINNQLTVIQGRLELAEKHLENDPGRAREHIAHARQAADDAEALVRWLGDAGQGSA